MEERHKLPLLVLGNKRPDQDFLIYAFCGDGADHMADDEADHMADDEADHVTTAEFAQWISNVRTE